ncbi:hypothetical protein [Streptomyces sp. NPDC047097]|uniref:hypothetical protein n=1 Tax=Streptomyces sp. NPDC047097 TaxID=3155260 RepID=UPI0033F699E0
MFRDPAETKIDAEGRVALPLGLLAEAGLFPRSDVIAVSQGDGRIVLRRAADAVRDPIEKGAPV